jgi:hypothetical protein
VLAEFRKTVAAHGIPASTLTDNGMVLPPGSPEAKADATALKTKYTASGSLKSTPAPTTPPPAARSSDSTKPSKNGSPATPAPPPSPNFRPSSMPSSRPTTTTAHTAHCPIRPPRQPPTPPAPKPTRQTAPTPTTGSAATASTKPPRPGGACSVPQPSKGFGDHFAARCRRYRGGRTAREGRNSRLVL